MSTTAATSNQPSASSVGPSSDRYLTFTLNEEMFALGIYHVTEILEHRSLTVVPMMPSFIRGVINLRGRVVPVVDLALRFSRGETAIGRRTSIIIVQVAALADSTSDPGTQDIGILVDSVNEVVELTSGDIEPPPAFGAGIRADYIAGMAKRENDFTIILDIDQVLATDDLAGQG